MSDDRIQRLTELARRIWPDQGAFVSWDAFYDTAKVINDRGTILAEIMSPQALDMLEAALLVGAHGRQAIVSALAKLSVPATDSVGLTVPVLPVDPAAEREVEELMRYAMERLRAKKGT